MKQNPEKQDAPQVPETMRFWESWRHVAPGRLKRISGGNLNGKTDINPIWRFEALTVNFGPVGFGWNIKEIDRWTNEAAGEIGAFVKVELRIKINGEWSEPIEGTGGSKLCGKGRGEGLNDEAWKMATTDAISVACKSLGLAADVYTGLQSHEDPDQKRQQPDFGSKYEDRSRQTGQNSTRNQQAGNYTSQPPRVQNRPQSAQNPGTYGPGPVYASNGAPAPIPQQQPEQQGGRIHIILATVTTGRCKNIIAALAAHDYDDSDDWYAGIQAIRDRYDVDDDALQEIQARAVELRNFNIQQQVNNQFLP